MDAPQQINSPVADYLSQWRRRRNTLRLVRRGGLLLVGSIIWWIAWGAVDRWARLGNAARSILFCAWAVLLLAALWRWKRRNHLGGDDWIQCANQVEACCDGFEQRLQTLVSQQQSATHYQGSPAILQQLESSLQQPMAAYPVRRILPWRRVAPALWRAAAACILLLSLCLINPLGMPRLLARQWLPLANIPPVTRTHIQIILPSQHDVAQDNAVDFAVAVSPPADVVRLLLSDNGRDWTQLYMSPQSPGRYVYHYAALRRDTHFAFAAGDAQTTPLRLKVLTRPAVRQFRVHYQYPSYTRRPPLARTSDDGSLEAPVGTEATLTVIANTDLAGGKLLVGQRVVALTATVEANAWQAKWTIEHDSPLALQMISTGNVVGQGPEHMSVRAVADQPPAIKLLYPTGDVRMRPRDVISVGYQAMDDYGLVKLLLESQVNGGPARTWPIALADNPRWAKADAPLDLALLDLHLGDGVTITLRVIDEKGQESRAEPFYVLIAPQSVSFNTRRRLAELKQAYDLSVAADADLRSAAESLQAPAADEKVLAEAQATSQRRLTAATELLAMRRQALLRAIACEAPPPLCNFLASQVDLTVQHLQQLESLLLINQSAVLERSAILQQVQNLASHSPAGPLLSIWQAQSAQALLAELENFKAPATTQPNSQLNRQRAMAEVQQAMAQLQIDPQAPDAAARLQKLVDAALPLLPTQAVDFASATRQWSDLVSQSDPAASLLVRRLGAAVEAEAVRPDADLPAARDLQLSAKAAENIQADLSGTPAATRPVGPRVQYPAALAALQKEHVMRRAQTPTADKEQQEIIAAAQAARIQMRRWSGSENLLAETPTQIDAGPTTSPANQTLRNLVLEASAQAQRRQYAVAAQLDQAAAPLSGGMPLAASQPSHMGLNMESAAAMHWRRIGQSMRAAQRIDQLLQEQDQLQRQTIAADPAHTRDLAQRQRTLAQAIEQTRSGQREVPEPRQPPTPPPQEENNTREQAILAIQWVQEQLAAMPQTLAQTQRMATVLNPLRHQEQSARDELANVQPDARQAAQRVLDRAAAAAQEALRQAESANAPARAQLAQEYSGKLRPFAPETAEAARALDERLYPALAAVEQSLRGGEISDRTFDSARQAIADVRNRLREALALLIDQDPLVAAKHFARAAAENLQRTPADLAQAQDRQQDARAALSVAWDQSIHQAAAGRMALTPSLAAISNAEPIVSSGALGAPSAPIAAPQLQWNRLRVRQGPAVNSSLRGEDPPGYQEPLKLYFQALGRAPATQP